MHVSKVPEHQKSSFFALLCTCIELGTTKGKDIKGFLNDDVIGLPVMSSGDSLPNIDSTVYGLVPIAIFVIFMVWSKLFLFHTCIFNTSVYTVSSRVFFFDYQPKC